MSGVIIAYRHSDQRGKLALSVALLLVGLLSGCAVVSESHNGKQVSRSLEFGVYRPLPETDGGYRRDTQIFGLGLTRQQFVIGYASQSVILLPIDTCTAIFFVESKVQVPALRLAFPNLADACIITRPSKPPKEGPSI